MADPTSLEEIDWPADQPDPQWTTHFVVQGIGPAKALVLTFGCGQPLVFGTPEQQQRQIGQTAKGGIPIRTLSRVVLPVVLARELHTILGTQLKLVQQHRDPA